MLNRKHMADLIAKLKHKWANRSARSRQRLWDRQYASGFGEFLSDPDEHQRYVTLVDFMVGARKNNAILDIGCGEGFLLCFLDSCGYQRYLGLDFSEVAIKNASKRANAKADFVCGPAESFVPDGRFDSIVFNECLYCFPHPMQVLHRYESYLAPGGVMIVSLFTKTDGSRRLASEISKTYRVFRCASVEHPKGVWHCSMLGPANL
jgi:2-polyprenyl-3-methyl-5-hydroxy-6-metoxy-1,4-benzoquinol methylase